METSLRDDPTTNEGAAAAPAADFGEHRLEEAAALLEAIAENRGVLATVPEPLRIRLLTAAGQVARPDKRARKALAKARLREEKLRKRAADQLVLNKTGIRKLRANPVFETPRWKALPAGGEAAPAPAAEPPIGQVHEERICYVCRKKHHDVHGFYDHMCLDCGDFNYAKRSQTADLTGRVALVTGSRVKIGYQAAIMLLRAGCSVVVTTRFPQDAARRYAAEADFEDWRHRLRVCGIDLRHTPSVEALCDHLLKTLPRLDFIINNACQTVRRPPGFYDHLMAAELAAPDTAPLSLAAQSLVDPVADVVTGASLVARDFKAPAALMTQLELIPEDAERGDHLYPQGQLDADEQQVDLRSVNSWRLKLDEVPTVELLEVHLVNAVAPFVLNARLKPLMAAVPTPDKHIVNVSAMEGQFYRVFKSDRHPHTNMAKASLNMMTRTSAIDYLEAGIHMNAVDTGWVTDEDPAALAERKREIHRFHPPLDIVDGAARIIDPIFSGFLTGTHVWGQFLKDYKETDW